LQAEQFGPAGECRRRLGNASLLSAMVGEIDDMNLNGICFGARSCAGSDQASTATA
jgi:hypothetical protein